MEMIQSPAQTLTGRLSHLRFEVRNYDPATCRQPSKTFDLSPFR